MAALTRRVFLAVALCVAPAARLFGAARQPAPTPISLDEFLELSGRLLGRSKLDPEIAQVYLNALSADPNSAPYLASLFEMNGNPIPEQVILSHTIMEWWYTGTYTVGTERKLATHTGALVWEAMEMPAAGTCAGAFGAWSGPPQNIA